MDNALVLICITRYGLKSENTIVNVLSDKNTKNAKNAKNTKNAKNDKNDENNKNEPLKHIYKKRKKPAGNITIKRVARRLFSPNKHIKTLPVPAIIDDYNYRINGINRAN